MSSVSWTSLFPESHLSSTSLCLIHGQGLRDRCGVQHRAHACCLLPAGWGIRSKLRGFSRVSEQVRVQKTGLRAPRGREVPQKLPGLTRHITETTGRRLVLGQHEASGTRVSCRHTRRMDSAPILNAPTASLDDILRDVFAQHFVSGGGTRL